MPGTLEHKLLIVNNLQGQRDKGPWCAVYTRHQHEKSVSEMLEAKGLEVFLPLFESTRRWKDRRKVLSLPLFPCYVFVRGATERRLPVLTTPGVHMIISRGERVATVPESEIEAIRRTVEGQFRVEPHPFLRCGERVRVTRGPLEGVEGVLTRKKNMFRLVLSVQMLAQSVAVEIDGLDVVPVSSARVVVTPRSEAKLASSAGRTLLAGD
jgi:transcription antitermination factor NusG